MSLKDLSLLIRYLILLIKSEGIQDSNKTLHKITINPSLEIVIGNLIEDLKMFSIVIAQDEAYFNNLFMKGDLTITEGI